MNTLIFFSILLIIVGSLVEFRLAIILSVVLLVLVRLGNFIQRLAYPRAATWLGILSSKHTILLVALPIFCLLWSSWHVEQALQHRLPLALHNQTQSFEGCVASVPERRQIPNSQRTYVRFELAVTDNAISPAGLRRVFLSWYQDDLPMRVGDCYRVVATLRTARNLANALPFDYEAYMLFRGIDATGYVRSLEPLKKADESYRLIPVQILEAFVHRIAREAASDNQADSVTASRWIRGLVFGDKQAFTPEEWRSVRDTGTLHLLVVSGLHVGLVGLIGLWFGRAIARVALMVVSVGAQVAQSGSYRVQRGAVVLAQILPGLSAILAVTGYVFLAGSGISLLRAWLMAVMCLLVWATSRRVQPLQLVLWAMLLLCLFNPMVWTQSGFCYSFAAVVSLVLVFVGSKQGWVSPWLTPQLAVLLLIFPVMMLWGQPISLSHLIANAVLIPLVSFALLPLSFLTFLSDWALLYFLLARLGELFWYSIELIQSLDLASFSIGFYPWVLFWLGVMTLFLLGASRRLLLLLCLFLVPVMLWYERPARGGLWLFDAGQGQSLLVSDGEYSLLLDTGARFSDAFSIADAVVIPWIRRIGEDRLEALIISHSDNDHAGGLSQILAAVSVKQVFLGQPERHRLPHRYVDSEPNVGVNCHQSEGRRLSDNLSFTFYPVPKTLQQTDNDASCLVQIQYFGHTILVPGDLTRSVEHFMVERYGEALKSDLLIAGHHGSKTSTSQVWLETVQPKWIWISAGFENRFGHPHASVMARINSLKPSVKTRVTADDGLIRLTPEGEVIATREQWQPRWRVTAKAPSVN